MKTAALLDTNVLLALAWPNHQDHAAAHIWFGKYARTGWATCAFTQLGFIRLSSNPAYTLSSVTPAEASALLRDLIGHSAHHFWPSPPAAQTEIFARALGHQQVNDAWLVEVARRNRGRLATLDKRLAVHALKSGLIEIIGG